MLVTPPPHLYLPAILHALAVNKALYAPAPGITPDRGGVMTPGVQPTGVPPTGIAPPDRGGVMTPGAPNDPRLGLDVNKSGIPAKHINGAPQLNYVHPVIKQLLQASGY